MVDLSDKQRRIAKLKAEGLKNKDIALKEYPQATPHSGEVLVSRQLQKPNVAQYYTKELAELLTEHGVTKTRYIQNIGEAMQATKQNQFTGEVVPDWGTRLNATKLAERFLDFEPDKTDTALDQSLKGLDTLELSRAVFKRS